MITVFSKASLPMERGVGRIHSQSRGRGHRKFFWGFAPRPPQVLNYFLAPPIQNVLRGPCLRLGLGIKTSGFIFSCTTTKPVYAHTRIPRSILGHDLYSIKAYIVNVKGRILISIASK